MPDKTCTACGTTKPIAEFVRSKAEPSGYTSRCKVCRRIASREYYERDRERHLRRFRVYKKNNPRYRDNAQKARARKAVGKAIQGGTLHRPESCSECFKYCKPEAHHDDYNQPLNVRWLCKTCHGKAHRLQESVA